MMKNDELKTLADLNGFCRLNKEFLNAQVDFWNNTIGDIGEKINEKVGNPSLAEYYCIKSDNKSGAEKKNNSSACREYCDQVAHNRPAIQC